MTTIESPLTAEAAAETHQPIIKRLFSFHGRVNRIFYIGMHFAWFFVTWFGWFILSAAGLALLRTFAHDVPKIHGAILLLFTVPWLAACVWVYFATVAKRFHDIDWRGASCLLVLVPFVGLFFVFALMFIRGTSGPNRYGPPPAGVDG